MWDFNFYSLSRVSRYEETRCWIFHYTVFIRILRHVLISECLTIRLLIMFLLYRNRTRFSLIKRPLEAEDSRHLETYQLRNNLIHMPKNWRFSTYQGWFCLNSRFYGSAFMLFPPVKWYMINTRCKWCIIIFVSYCISC